MSETITVRGFVATDPARRTTNSGMAVSNFRLASTDRRFDRATNTWVDGQTNWFTVNLFRNLALNAGASLSKGQPVVVTGRLKVRQWQSEERAGTSVEVDADAVGHDLSLGTASFTRSQQRPATTSVDDPEDTSGAESDDRTDDRPDRTGAASSGAPWITSAGQDPSGDDVQEQDPDQEPDDEDAAAHREAVA